MAEMMTPLEFVWDGDAMHVRQRHQKLADAQFVVGQSYRMEALEERSAVSHSHFFACVAEAHANLPDDLAERFPTPDHLRRYALIKAGYFDATEFSCSSNAEAVRLRSYVGAIDDYAVVIVRGNAIRRLTAKSQNMRSMNKQEFQDSKEKVLGVVAGLVGISREALRDNAGRAA